MRPADFGTGDYRHPATTDTRRIEAGARARFNHAAKTDGAWELLSPPQRAFHLAGMRAALDAMEAVR